MRLEDLIMEKFENFKFLLASNVLNDENEHFITIMNYKIEDIFFFYEKNIKQYYDLFGMDIVVQSFFNYLELDQTNSELKDKVRVYFEFFQDVMSERENDTKNEVEYIPLTEADKNEYFE